MIVDGSFVTSVAEPDHDFSAGLRPFEYNVLSRRQARRRYGIDVLVAAEASVAAAEYEAFFANVRGAAGRRKGNLRFVLD